MSYLVVNERRGQTKHPLWVTWQDMKARCYRKNAKDYNRYGGRGVTICERWLGYNGFWNFVEDMGERPDGYTLDRIDTNGNYEPSNCRWASKHQQQANRIISVGNIREMHDGRKKKFNVRLTVDGVRKSKYCETKKEAEIILAGWKRELDGCAR